MSRIIRDPSSFKSFWQMLSLDGDIGPEGTLDGLKC